MKATTEPSRRDVHPVALASATVTVIIIGLYFVGYRAFNAAPFYVKPGLFAYAKTALKYLASGFGRGASLPWKQVPCALLMVILLATSLCLFKALAPAPGGRPLTSELQLSLHAMVYGNDSRQNGLLLL